MDWILMQDGHSGEVVVKNGRIIELSERCGSRYLFDDLIYPRANLLPAHLPFSLVQRATLRLGDAIDVVQDLKWVLEKWAFKNTSYTELLSRPFSVYRNRQRFAKVRAGLTALIDSMSLQIANLDFKGVGLHELNPPDEDFEPSAEDEAFARADEAAELMEKEA